MIGRLAARLDLAVVLIAFVVAVTAFNIWGRSQWTYTSGTVRNMSNADAVVRVTDASTGVVKGVWAIAPNSSANVVDGRPERWLLDPSPEEVALGRQQGFKVELLAGGACSLLADARLDDDSPTVDVVSGGLAITNYEIVAMTGVEEPRAIADPCGGGPAPARGIIANLTSRPAIVGEGFVIPPCSTRVAIPGDMAIRSGVSAGVRFHVPSIEAQDERWPLEPRSVTIRRDGVFDDESVGWGFDEGELARCRATSPR